MTAASSGVALERQFRGADEGEPILEGDDEDDPAVRVLEDQGVIPVMDFRHHQVAALDQPQALAHRYVEHALGDALGPRPGGIDHGPGDEGELGPAPKVP